MGTSNPTQLSIQAKMKLRTSQLPSFQVNASKLKVKSLTSTSSQQRKQWSNASKTSFQPSYTPFNLITPFPSKVGTFFTHINPLLESRKPIIDLFDQVNTLRML